MKRFALSLVFMLGVLLLCNSGLAALAENVLKLPANLKEIGAEAFCDDTSLDQVVLGDQVTKIDNFAFQDSSVKSITIPASVTSISVSAFDNCANLLSINVSENNPVYRSVDGVLLTKDGTEVILCPSGKTGEYSIPNSVTSIGEKAFYDCTSLTNVTIPDSVTSIGERAFFHCTSLMNVTIPNSVTSIERETFRDCTSLAEVVIPNSVTSIGVRAFYNCRSLMNVTIPNSVTSIGERAFFQCTSLMNVTIPNSVTSIERETFRNCTSLAEVVIPNSVTSIGEEAFCQCASLPNVTIPNSVTSICGRAFYGCSGLESVTFLNGDTVIASLAFDNCRKLKEFSAPVYSAVWQWIQTKIYRYWVQSDGTVVIRGYEGTETDLVIPASISGKPVKHIDIRAFNGCSSLTSVTIPNSVTSIGREAFCNCTSLKSVSIPNSVTSIGREAFCNCTSLKSVSIPNSVTSIGASAFSDCSSLTSVIISNSVTSIGASTFSDCSSLTSVTIPNSVTSIGMDAFHHCTNLLSVSILNGVKSIGDSAFSLCQSLTHVSIPNSVTSIGNDAFIGCYALTSVIIPSSVTSIGNKAFSGCYALTSVTLPNSVTSIGDNAFAECFQICFKCPAGSFAESYAKSRGIEVKTIEILDTVPTEIDPKSVILGIIIDITGNEEEDHIFFNDFANLPQDYFSNPAKRYRLWYANDPRNDFVLIEQADGYSKTSTSDRVTYSITYKHSVNTPIYYKIQWEDTVTAAFSPQDPELNTSTCHNIEYPTLSHEMANKFLGLLYKNFGKSYTNNKYFKLLTGDFVDIEDEALNELAWEFSIFARESIVLQYKESGIFADTLRSGLEDYYKAKYHDMNKDRYKEVAKSFTKKTKYLLVDILNNLRPEGVKVSDDMFDDIEFGLDVYDTFSSAVEKISTMVESMVNVAQSFIMEAAKDVYGRSEYLLSYLSARARHNKNDIAFLAILDCQVSVCTADQAFPGLIKGTSWVTEKDNWQNHRDELNLWAEYLYLLERALKS